jgi:hypothetical protein
MSHPKLYYLLFNHPLCGQMAIRSDQLYEINASRQLLQPDGSLVYRPVDVKSMHP